MDKINCSLGFDKEKDPAGIVAEWNPLQGKSEVPKDEVDPAKASAETSDDCAEDCEDNECDGDCDELEATSANPNASGMALPADTEKVDITMGAVPQGNENMGADIHNGVGNGPTETVLPTQISEYTK